MLQEELQVEKTSGKERRNMLDKERRRMEEELQHSRKQEALQQRQANDELQQMTERNDELQAEVCDCACRMLCTIH